MHATSSIWTFTLIYKISQTDIVDVLSSCVILTFYPVSAHILYHCFKPQSFYTTEMHSGQPGQRVQRWSEQQGRRGPHSAIWSPLLAICVNHNLPGSFTLGKDRMTETGRVWKKKSKPVRRWHAVSKDKRAGTTNKSLVAVTIYTFIYYLTRY